MKSEKTEREATSLKPTEIERLLRTAEESLPLRHYALLLTALRAGLREGELAALQWGDIQFGHGEDPIDRYILVQRNYDRRWSRKMLTPKNRKARRVDMSRELRQALLALRDDRFIAAFAQGKSDTAEELVFPSEAGTPIEMNNFCQRIFHPLVTRAGLRKIRFHDLRHVWPSAHPSRGVARVRAGSDGAQLDLGHSGCLWPLNSRGQCGVCGPSGSLELSARTRKTAARRSR